MLFQEFNEKIYFVGATNLDFSSLETVAGQSILPVSDRARDLTSGYSLHHRKLNLFSLHVHGGVDINFNTRTHGGSKGNFLDKRTLGAGGARLADSGGQRCHVLE